MVCTEAISAGSQRVKDQSNLSVRNKESRPDGCALEQLAYVGGVSNWRQGVANKQTTPA
jgi:hypothetical protein